jgi:hypothetical protein
MIVRENIQKSLFICFLAAPKIRTLVGLEVANCVLGQTFWNYYYISNPKNKFQMEKNTDSILSCYNCLDYLDTSSDEEL